MTSRFALGWNPDRSLVAQASLLASGRYCKLALKLSAPPPSWSLSSYRLRHLEQFAAGECWAHSPVQMLETSAGALGFERFPASRWFAGWVGKQIEGGGSPGDGGDPTDAIVAMTAANGVGIAHEDLAPYISDLLDEGQASAALALRPPDTAFEDAKGSHLVAPVVVGSDLDAMNLIAAGHGVCNGIWWPYGWDDQQTFMTEIGPGKYGHSLLEIGYAVRGVFPGVYGQYDWWQLDNWHGLLYPPLPPDFAAKVPDYAPITPEATSDFWVMGDVYRQVRSLGPSVRVSATDLGGLRRKVVVPSAENAFVL